MIAVPPITEFWGFLIRLLIAVALGTVIGTERQLTKHMTGIVTNVIVCVGAFAFTAFSYLAAKENAGTDVTRIAAQIVSGIGFLGAGVIISDGTKVKGINTAASIWAAASVGILCCLDKCWYAVAVAGTIVFSHLIIHPVSDFIQKRQQYDKEKTKKLESFYRISIVCSEDNADEIKTNLIQYLREIDDILLRNLEMSDQDNGNVKVRAEISTKTKNNELVEHIITHVGKHENIISTGWKHID